MRFSVSSRRWFFRILFGFVVVPAALLAAGLAVIGVIPVIVFGIVMLAFGVLLLGGVLLAVAFRLRSGLRPERLRTLREKPDLSRFRRLEKGREAFSDGVRTLRVNLAGADLQLHPSDVMSLETSSSVPLHVLLEDGVLHLADDEDPAEGRPLPEVRVGLPEGLDLDLNCGRLELAGEAFLGSVRIVAGLVKTALDGRMAGLSVRGGKAELTHRGMTGDVDIECGMATAAFALSQSPERQTIRMRAGMVRLHVSAPAGTRVRTAETGVLKTICCKLPCDGANPNLDVVVHSASARVVLVPAEAPSLAGGTVTATV